MKSKVDLNMRNQDKEIDYFVKKMMKISGIPKRFFNYKTIQQTRKEKLEKIFNEQL